MSGFIQNKTDFVKFEGTLTTATEIFGESFKECTLSRVLCRFVFCVLFVCLLSLNVSLVKHNWMLVKDGDHVHRLTISFDQQDGFDFSQSKQKVYIGKDFITSQLASNVVQSMSLFEKLTRVLNRLRNYSVRRRLTISIFWCLFECRTTD